MHHNLETKLQEILGQPVGNVKIMRESSSARIVGGGYAHGYIRAYISFECSGPLERTKYGSLRIGDMTTDRCYMHPPICDERLYIYRCSYTAQLLKGKETDELFFACAKDFLPDLVAP